MQAEVRYGEVRNVLGVQLQTRTLILGNSSLESEAEILRDMQTVAVDHADFLQKFVSPPQEQAHVAIIL